MNKVFIMGRLGADPVLKVTASGLSIANLSVATTEREKIGSEWRERTEWHKVVVFAKKADACNEFLVKGSQVLVEGSIKTRSWEDNKGVKRYSTDIICNEITFLSPKTASNKNEVSDEFKNTPAPNFDEQEELPF